MEQWLPKYTKILILHNKNIPVNKIAESVSLSAVHVSRIIHSPEYQSKLEALQKTAIKDALKDSKEDISDITKARDVIHKNALKAAITVAKLSRRAKPTDRIRFEAAKDILDRAGLKPEEKLEIRDRVFSPEELEGMRSTLGEIENMTVRLSNTGSRFLIPPTPRSSGTDKGSDDNITSTVDNPQTLPDINIPIPVDDSTTTL